MEGQKRNARIEHSFYTFRGGVIMPILEGRIEKLEEKVENLETRVKRLEENFSRLMNFMEKQVKFNDSQISINNQVRDFIMNKGD